jgi:hypothetical protein
MKQDGQYALEFKGKYDLPVCDTQRERRNFPGYVEYENMLSMTDTSGTTDTDVKTHGNSGKGEGYTKIYRKG